MLPSSPEFARNDLEDARRFLKETETLFAQLQETPLDRGDAKLLARATQELVQALQMMQAYRGRPRVTIYGSARTRPEEPIFQMAEAFGRAIAEAGYMVVTGAGEGIMGAAHKGAGVSQSIGFNILLPFEQQANATIHGDPKLLSMNYFFTRKLMLLKESRAVVLFPGGFGTFDEAFEVLTLLQTGKSSIIPVVLVDTPNGTYWERWLEYMQGELLRQKLISPEDLSLWRITHSVTEAVYEVVHFYRIYHSQRFVKGMFNLRLQARPSPTVLQHLATHFIDLHDPGGAFRLGEAHPYEQNEPDLLHLTRLYFPYHRRNPGRLRQLIDFLNDEVELPTKE